jgi:hypothetical protein
MHISLLRNWLSTFRASGASRNSPAKSSSVRDLSEYYSRHQKPTYLSVFRSDQFFLRPFPENR